MDCGDLGPRWRYEEDLRAEKETNEENENDRMSFVKKIVVGALESMSEAAISDQLVKLEK